VEKHIAKRSGELFNSGFYCAESVLIGVAEALDISSEIIPKIATGFCSGLARTCDICGAVSGAVMGISLARGRSSVNETEDDCYAVVQEFFRRFTSKFGSINCLDLTGCDLGKEAGRNKFEEQDTKIKCTDYVVEAVNITLNLLEEM